MRSSSATLHCMLMVPDGVTVMEVSMLFISFCGGILNARNSITVFFHFSDLDRNC